MKSHRTIFADLDLKHQFGIAPALRPYFDRVTMENADQWLMRYRYGFQSFMEGFEVPWNDDQDELIRFEQRKLFLFLNGTALYAVRSMEDIVLEAFERNRLVMSANVYQGKNQFPVETWLEYDWMKSPNINLDKLLEVNVHVLWIGHCIQAFVDSIQEIQWPLFRTLYVVMSIPDDGMDIDIDAIKAVIQTCFPKSVDIVLSESRSRLKSRFQVDIFMIK